STSKTPSYTKSVSWQHHPPDYVLNPGKNTLNFTAYLISRDGRMTSGEFTAVTHFVVNYL
ncbi:hypothetical protein AAGG34_16245, partial [Citrobacter braakii]|nr:hypothetical protein [Citrobacter braakii]